MVILKIFPLEDTEEENASILSEGEHVVGRGALNCYDKRVSRKHAVISVCKDLVTIKAIHINPCFFKAAKGGGVTILSKDTSVVLNDGDQFAFLPSLFWFKVRLSDSDILISTNPSTSKRNIEEVPVEILKRQKICNENVEHRKPIDGVLSTSGSDLPNSLNEPANVLSNSTESIDPKILINNLTSIVNEDFGNGTNETSVTSNDNGLVRLIKKEKTEHDENSNRTVEAEKEDAQNNSSKSSNMDTNISNTDHMLDHAVETIKIEASTSDEGQTESKSDVQNKDGIHNAVKTEIVTEETDNKTENEGNDEKEENGNTSKADDPNKASCSANDNSKTRRERCWYGPTCYRKNPIHRADFSHPGDADYDSDPDDDRPFCPFGITCYRKNLQHRRQYKHSNPPAPKPNDGTNNKNQKKKNNDSESEDSDNSQNKPKKRKAATKKRYNQDSSEDDYDLNDPFIDDATSDEFQLSNDDDDDDSTDWDDSEKVDEESQETRRLLKEAKRFTKAKKK